MSEVEKKPAQVGDDYIAPTPSSSQHSIQTLDGNLDYTATAEWIVLQKNEKPRAEMFCISYTVTSDKPRPITFVFNGGPGASSVYLHLGAMGPKIARFTPEGGLPPAPHVLEDNPETWLRFTDLVFIDPIGTGFSRMIPDKSSDDGKDAGKDKDGESTEYWQLERDLKSLGEAISRYLSIKNRWESPVYIAGESYGGFRSAKLAKMLQADYGVGLTGAIIISPALEFTLLDGSDYDVLMWLDSFPSMAAAAYIHKKSRAVKDGESVEDYMKRAAEFAVTRLLPVLAAGNMYGDSNRDRVLASAGDFLGISREVMKRKGGRVTIDWFVKNLLREEGVHLGLYDVSARITDPYPDRDSYSGPDPTLHQLEQVFAAGINTQLRHHIGLKTDRDYHLLSNEVNEKWKIDTKRHALESQVGATDDLRFGMTLNPHMKVYLCHGYYDLVTPYFAAERISRLMKLSEELQKNLTMRHFHGGHMFYSWESSRSAFAQDMKQFYTQD